MATPSEDGFLQEYQSQKHTYREFAGTLADLLSTILMEHRVAFQSVTHRAKEDISLVTKLRRPDRTYACLSEVTDLAGVRVITYFYDDVDRVARLIEREFGIDQTNSVDKRSLMDPDRFGYVSLHYVIELSPQRSKMPEYRRFAGMKAELQIRSLLQHVWAETEHDLGYKSTQSVPKLIRRRFARLAGMLEIADAEFVALRNELSRYENEVPALIEDEPSSVQIDKASLASYFQSSETLRRSDEAIGALTGAKVVSVPSLIDLYLGHLSFIGISTLGELEAALRANEEAIRQFSKTWLAGHKHAAPPTTHQGISIFYLVYVTLGKKRDPARIRVWADKMSVDAQPKRDALVQRVIDVANKLKL